MAGFVEVWPRPFGQPAEGRKADVYFACFSKGPLQDDTQVDAAKYGIPSLESAQGIEVRGQSREHAPEWFDRWRAENAMQVAAQHLGQAASRLQEVDHCHTIRSVVPDCADLGYLQASWALTRWLVARGANVVLDVRAGRFIPGEAVSQMPPDAPFDVRREVLLVMDPTPRAPDEEHWFHTRGLLKAGRPDLICAGEQKDGNLIANLFLGLADAMFKGAMPQSPQHEVRIGEDINLFLRPPDEGLVKTLGLENDALQLVDAEGESLGGLASWLKVHHGAGPTLH